MISRWILAFAFGLIHDFGFANVLSELGLPDQALLTSLAGLKSRCRSSSASHCIIFQFR